MIHDLRKRQMLKIPPANSQPGTVSCTQPSVQKCDVNCCFSVRDGASPNYLHSLYTGKNEPMLSTYFRKENLPLLDAFPLSLNKLKSLLMWIKRRFIEYKINHLAISQTRHLSVLAHTSFHSVKKQGLPNHPSVKYTKPKCLLLWCLFNAPRGLKNKHLVSGFQ